MDEPKMKSSRYAGELLTAAELSRLGLVVSLHNTFGVNTPAFDLTAGTEDGEETVQIQVKALKSPNAFLIDPEKVKEHVFYVFVIVGEPDTKPVFHVARGKQILDRETELFGKFGRKYQKHGRGIQSSRLPEEWRNAWHTLGMGIKPKAVTSIPSKKTNTLENKARP